MSSADFESFVEAVASRGGSGTSGPDVPGFDRVTVLGGGVDARLLACLCLAAGAEVTMFSAYGSELDALRAAGGITLRGEGPSGTYPVDQEEAAASIRTTAELDRAVAEAELIFLTGPVHKQRTYAMVLADHLSDGQVLVLAPGRSLGAVEAAWLLRVGGTAADVTLVEAQSLPYWTRTEGAVLHLTSCPATAAAALPSNRSAIVMGLQRFLPNIVSAQSTVHSGFADGSGLVEVPALMLGGPCCVDGSAPLPPGAVPLEERRTFRSLIGSRHLTVISAMADERRRVAARFGVRDLPDTGTWIDVHAGSEVGEMARPIPDAETAAHLVRCAVVGSLVPMVSAARLANIPAPATEAMVALAATALDSDLSSAGRRLETIGIDAASIDDARRIIDAISRGER